MPGKLSGCYSTGTEGCCCSGTGDSCSSGTDEHCNSGTDKRCNSGTDECCCLGSTVCCNIELETAAAREMGSMLGCRLEAGNLGLDDRRLRSRLKAGKLGLKVCRMKGSWLGGRVAEGILEARRLGELLLKMSVCWVNILASSSCWACAKDSRKWRTQMQTLEAEFNAVQWFTYIQKQQALRKVWVKPESSPIRQTNLPRKWAKIQSPDRYNIHIYSIYIVKAQVAEFWYTAVHVYMQMTVPFISLTIPNIAFNIVARSDIY